MVKTKPKTEASSQALYARDFYLWTQEQARLLRERRFDELDIANLIDEVASVGTSDKREIRSRLEIVVAHLLKWKYQPGRRGASWRDTLLEQRAMLAGIIEDSPSLAPYLREMAVKRYRGGRLLAARETGLALRVFPATCPFTADEILDAEFYPEDPAQE